MPALWTYPWTLSLEGVDDACERLGSLGVDALNVASHYHSVRSMRPRSPDDLFRARSGGCYFAPDGAFADVPVEAPVDDVEPWDDPLGAIADGVRDHGFAVNAWTVCLHGSRLGALNPAYRIESAFGDAHDHSLCPSHRAVRDYFGAVVAAIAARGVDEIQLESLGFPSAFHGHGTTFGHDKRQTVTTASGEALLSQCFCDGCRTAAASHPVDFERARSRVRALVRESLADPTCSPPPIDALVEEDPTLRSLFEFRASVVESLVERLAEAAGSTPLNYYVAEAFGSDAAALEATGVALPALEPHLDRVTAMCYVPDAETARDRITDVSDAVDLPVDAGLTLDPDVVDDSDQFGRLVDAVRAATGGDVSVYHHSLATETQFEWVGAALD